MDSKADAYIKRAFTELESARVLFESSIREDARNLLNIEKESTFFSGTISHSYYAIFYSAKALLLMKGIETAAPSVHAKTFDAFQKTFIDTGILDMKLLEIYRKMVIRAEVLLEIYRKGRRDREKFTYSTISQANREPAKESIENARIFFKHIYAFCERF